MCLPSDMHLMLLETWDALVNDKEDDRAGAITLP